MGSSQKRNIIAPKMNKTTKRRSSTHWIVVLRSLKETSIFSTRFLPVFILIFSIIPYNWLLPLHLTGNALGLKTSLSI